MGRRLMSDAAWAEHVAAWKASGLTEAAYCRQHGLAEKSLGRWQGRQRDKLGKHASASGALTLVQANIVRPEMAQSARIIAPQGWQLEFGALPPSAWVRKLVEGVS